MSPAVVNSYPGYARIFGGRQSARSIHFLTMLGFLAFLIVHVTLVVMTGFVRNMDHIVMGTDDYRSSGVIWGVVGIAIVVLVWIVASHLSWNRPCGLQHALSVVTYPMQLLALNRLNQISGIRTVRSRLISGRMASCPNAPIGNNSRQTNSGITG